MNTRNQIYYLKDVHKGLICVVSITQLIIILEKYIREFMVAGVYIRIDF